MKHDANRADLIVYQAKTGAIEFKHDLKSETIWASLQQISELFETDKSGVSRHIKNIFNSGELERRSTVAKIATVKKEGGRIISREIESFNLDVILSVGYRINSKKATMFRAWATKTLRQHVVTGFTINKKIIAKNYDVFLSSIEEIKKLLPSDNAIGARDVLELIKTFASTWVSLDAYDRSQFPKSGSIKKRVAIAAEDLNVAIQELKDDLTEKREAGDLFARPRHNDSVAGIVGNVFQSFGGKDVYPSVEEKAAHLLYFMVKNHPFVDGNKRSGAFAFVWFLSRAKILNTTRMTPEALTALTLLIAESKPSDKARMTGLVLMLLL